MVHRLARSGVHWLVVPEFGYQHVFTTISCVATIVAIWACFEFYVWLEGGYEFGGVDPKNEVSNLW